MAEPEQSRAAEQLCKAKRTASRLEWAARQEQTAESTEEWARVRKLLGKQDARAFSDAFSGAFSDWSTRVRRLFRKDAAFRTWQRSSAWFT
jgi:hypothetical protein